MKQKVLSAFALMALVVVGLLLPAPASAAVTPVWVANSGSTIVGDHTVKLTGGNTSVEAADLGLVLEAETPVSFEWEATENPAECIGGAPRVFLVVDGKNVNSWDQNIGDGVSAACAGGFKVPAGKVTQAGVVWDNGQTGTVTVSNLTIGDTKMNFKATTGEPDPVKVTPAAPTVRPATCEAAGVVVLPEVDGVTYTKGEPADGKVTVTAKAQDGYVLEGTTEWTLTVPGKLTGPECEPKPTPSTSSPSAEPTDEPTSQPTASPSETSGGSTPTPSSSASVGLTPVGGNAGGSGGLPLTGSKPLFIGGFGLLLISVGGLLMVWMRRRAEGHGDNDIAIGRHRADGDTQVFPAI